MTHYFTHSNPNGSLTIWYEENGYRISFTDKDDANTEYQKYLKWLSEGNVAEEWSPDAAQ